MARFQNLPPELFDDIHKHCDPKSRLNLLQVSRIFYEWFIQSHLKHVKVVGFQNHVSTSLARLLDADVEGHTTKNLRCIQTASIQLKFPIFLDWDLCKEGRPMKYVDDALVPRIISLTTQATGLKFLMLEANLLTLTQDEKFRQMLERPGKWMIQTLSIKGSAKTTLACLDKCDPMQLIGVDIDPELPEVKSPASPFSVAEDAGILTPEYNVLKDFYKMRDDSKNQRPLLKRLCVRYVTDSIYPPQTLRLLKRTSDEVALIKQDFPNLEWLIILEEQLLAAMPNSPEHDLQAWEDLIEQFITTLNGTKLIKLAFVLSWPFMGNLIKLSSSDSTRPVTDIQIHECYLRLARRLVESVEGLKDVAIVYKYRYYYNANFHYRATQSENGKIKSEKVDTRPKQTFYQFPYGLLDTWA